jgi:hypothetical protein
MIVNEPIQLQQIVINFLGVVGGWPHDAINAHAFSENLKLDVVFEIICLHVVKIWNWMLYLKSWKIETLQFQWIPLEERLGAIRIDILWSIANKWTWQFEPSDGYFLLPRIAKDARTCYRDKKSEERGGRKQKVETQAQTVLTLNLDQITKFVYCLDGPLGEGNIMYSSLTLSVFWLDRVKFSFYLTVQPRSLWMFQQLGSKNSFISEKKLLSRLGLER